MAAPSPKRLLELKNRPAASSKAHIAVAHRPEIVPVLAWTRIHCTASTRVGNKTGSAAYKPSSQFQEYHFTPDDAVAATCSDQTCSDHHPRIEKLNSPPREKDKYTKPPALRRCHGEHRCGEKEIKANLLDVEPSSPSRHHQTEQ